MGGCAQMRNHTMKSAGSHLSNRWDSFSSWKMKDRSWPCPEETTEVLHLSPAVLSHTRQSWSLQPQTCSGRRLVMEVWTDQGAYSWSFIQLSTRWIITSLTKPDWLLYISCLPLFILHCFQSPPPSPSCSIILTSGFPLIFLLSRHHTGELSLLLHLSRCLLLETFGVLMGADLWARYHSWYIRHSSNSQLHFTSIYESGRAFLPSFWRPVFGNPSPNVPIPLLISGRIKTLLEWELPDSDVQVGAT